MKNIYTKLMEVRVKFHKLELKKSGHNKFAGFRYYELGDFLVPATQLLQEVNLCPIITFNNEVATMTLINGDNPEEQIQFTSPMRELSLKGANEIQALGGIQTYLTRYLYIQLLNVVEADSFDAVSGKEEGEKKVANTTNTISEAQAKRLYAIGNKAGITKEQIIKVIEKEYSINDVMKLNREQYNEICERLEAKVK